MCQMKGNTTFFRYSRNETGIQETCKINDLYAHLDTQASREPSRSEHGDTFYVSHWNLGTPLPEVGKKLNPNKLHKSVQFEPPNFEHKWPERGSQKIREHSVPVGCCHAASRAIYKCRTRNTTQRESTQGSGMQATVVTARSCTPSIPGPPKRPENGTHLGCHNVTGVPHAGCLRNRPHKSIYNVGLPS